MSFNFLFVLQQDFFFLMKKKIVCHEKNIAVKKITVVGKHSLGVSTHF